MKFVKEYESREFQETSEAHRQIALQNIYPYRGSRKGYARLEEEVRTALKLKEGEPVTRDVLWKVGRQGKDGNYASQEVREIIERMEALSVQAASGEIVFSGRHDLLAMALGKEEHPGRVKGVGEGETIKQYFGCQQPTSTSQEDTTWKQQMEERMNEMMNMVATLVQEKEQLQQISQDLLQKLTKMQPHDYYVPHLVDNGPSRNQMCNIPIQNQGIASSGENHAFIDPNRNKVPTNSCETEVHVSANQEAACNALNSSHGADKKETWLHCSLFWPNLNVQVALGRVCVNTTGTIILHSRPLQAGYKRVIVDTPVLDDASLPCPLEDISTVRDAIGTFIAWPESHIQVVKKPQPSRNSQKSTKESSTKHAPEKSLQEELKEEDMHLRTQRMHNFFWFAKRMKPTSPPHGISIPEEIFSYQTAAHLYKDDILKWLKQSEVEGCHMQIYCRYLLRSVALDLKICSGFFAHTKYLLGLE